MHAKKALWVLFLALLLSGALGRPAAAEAQTPPAQVAQVSCVPQADALTCELLVYLPDTYSGDPAALAVYHAGHVQPPDEVTAVAAPPHVVVMIDVSGSEDGYTDSDHFKQLLQSALSALPVGTQVAVVPFRQGLAGGHAVALGQESFTGDPTVWQAAVGALEAMPGDGTCLYDATHQAIAFLRQTVGPSVGKAILLISDGQDEPSRGERGPRCSAHTLEEVVALAAGDPVNQVEISAIALGAEVQRDVLQALAGATGGQVGAYGDTAAVLSAAVRRVHRPAWRVRVRLWPNEGDNRATLVATLPGGPVAADFEFHSPTSYPFAAVAIRGIYYDPQKQAMQLVAELVNPQNVAGWEVQLFLGNDGVQALYPRPFVFPTLENLQIIDLPTDGLSEGGTYRAQLCAIGQAALRLTQEGGPVCAEAPFVYQPTGLSFNAFLELQGETLRVDVRLTPPDESAIAYEAQLFGKDGFRKQRQAGPLEAGGVTIPLAGLPEGEYSLLLALTLTGRTPVYQTVGFVYTPPGPAGPGFAIGSWTVTAAGELALNLSLATPAPANTAYTVWLKRENGELVAGPVQGVLAGNTITVPLGDTATGDYVVEVALGHALNSQPLEVHIQGPGRLSALLAGLRQRPASLVAIVAVAAAASLLLGLRHVLARLRTGAVGLEPIRGAPLPGQASRPLWRAVLPALLGSGGGRQLVGEVALTGLPDAARSIASHLPWSRTGHDRRGFYPVAAYPGLRLTVAASPDNAPAAPLHVDHFPFTIGREGCDLVIDDGKVSRRHAVITAAGGHLLIADCGSKNGTRLNEQPLAKGVPVRLPPGAARLLLGKATELTLEIVPGAVSAVSGREQNISRLSA